MAIEDDCEISIEMRAALAAIGRKGARSSWEKTSDRSARTAPARKAMALKFLTEANGDPVEAERLKKEHFVAMAERSAEARRQKRAESEQS